MARFEAEGKKLVPEEKAKRDEHPFDAYARLKAEARPGSSPRASTTSAGASTGCSMPRRRRTPSCAGCASRTASSRIGSSRGIADAAERYGGGYAHVTTRANLQIREIAAANGPPLIEALNELGVNPKGAGADNIRNVTGSPTAGIDPQELLDTRPYASAWHHHILNEPHALRPAAQVQRRLRRRRRHPGARGHQRHRLHGRDRRRGRSGGARRVVPARARRHHRPPGLRAAHRRAGEAR